MARNANSSFVFKYSKFIHLVSTMTAFDVKNTMKYDLGVKGQCQNYLNSACMACNANSFVVHVLHIDCT